MLYSFGIVESALLDEWDEPWGGDFLDRDGIVVEMNPLFVSFTFDARFCREDTDLAVSRLDDFLGSGDGDTEDFTIWETNLLEVSDRVSSRRVASEDDDGRTLIEEKLDSFLGVSSDGRIVKITIRTPSVIAKIQIIILRQESTKLLKNRKSPKS